MPSARRAAKSPAAKSPSAKSPSAKSPTRAVAAGRDRRAAVLHAHDLHTALHAALALASPTGQRGDGAPPDLGAETGLFVMVRQALGSARAALAVPLLARLGARFEAAGIRAYMPRIPDDAAAVVAEAHHFAHAAIAVLTTGDRRTPADGAATSLSTALVSLRAAETVLDGFLTHSLAMRGARERMAAVEAPLAALRGARA